MNSYKGGQYQEAISGLTMLNNGWYDGKVYQTYGFEYKPGSDGYIEFFIGDIHTWRVNGAATRANGNVGPRPIPQEPMALVLNLGMSPSFSFIDLDKLNCKPTYQFLLHIYLLNAFYGQLYSPQKCGLTTSESTKTQIMKWLPATLLATKLRSI